VTPSMEEALLHGSSSTPSAISSSRDDFREHGGGGGISGACGYERGISAAAAEAGSATMEAEEGTPISGARCRPAAASGGSLAAPSHRPVVSSASICGGGVLRTAGPRRQRISGGCLSSTAAFSFSPLLSVMAPSSNDRSQGGAAAGVAHAL
jgi:hypothetical protein